MKWQAAISVSARSSSRLADALTDECAVDGASPGSLIACCPHADTCELVAVVAVVRDRVESVTALSPIITRSSSCSKPAPDLSAVDSLGTRCLNKGFVSPHLPQHTSFA